MTFPVNFYQIADITLFLSTIVKVQATIFGIFLSINFLVIQTTITQKYTSADSISKHFISFPFLFLTFSNSLSMVYNLILIIHSETYSVNVFWPLFFSLFSIILLIPYMYLTASSMIRSMILAEIKSGTPRYSLDGIDLSFDATNLEHVDFKGRSLKNVNFKNSNLQEALFLDSDLEYADFSKSELSNAIFERANMARANMEGCSGVNVNFKQANLNKSKFKGAKLRGAHFDDAILKKSDLSDSDLSESYFTNAACLIGTDLTRAKLIKANFTSARLNSSNLSYAKLQGANLTKIDYDDITLESLQKAELDQDTLMDKKLRYELKKSRIQKKSYKIWIQFADIEIETLEAFTSIIPIWHRVNLAHGLEGSGS